MYTELSYEAQKAHVDLNTAILSCIIKNRYPALKETFGITHLEPVVHIDSLYYRPALEADDLIYWNMSRLNSTAVCSMGMTPRFRSDCRLYLTN